MNWYFVRHGEIDSNIKKVYAGQSPEGLTEKGRLQARLMAEKLLNLGIEAIYSSPVARAVETAEIIGACLDKRPIQEEAFKEIGLGPWEGMSEAEAQRNFPQAWQVWNTRPAELIMEGRETLGELRQRVIRGLAAIRARNGCSSVLVVTHVAIIRVMLLHWQNQDLNLYRTLPIPHGKIFQLAGDKELTRAK